MRATNELRSDEQTPASYTINKEEKLKKEKTEEKPKDETTRQPEEVVAFNPTVQTVLHDNGRLTSRFVTDQRLTAQTNSTHIDIASIALNIQIKEDLGFAVKYCNVVVEQATGKVMVTGPKLRMGTANRARMVSATFFHGSGRETVLPIINEQAAMLLDRLAMMDEIELQGEKVNPHSGRQNARKWWGQFRKLELPEVVETPATPISTAPAPFGTDSETEATVLL